MSTGPIASNWHDHFPHRPSILPRCVEPAACEPRLCHRDPFRPEPFHVFLAHDPFRPQPFHEFLEHDTFEHVPFDTFLDRQNQEFHAAVARHHASRTHRDPAPQPLARASSDVSPTPASSHWPHIGDITPVTPPPPPDRLRTAYQILPPIRPGRVVDLLL